MAPVPLLLRVHLFKPGCYLAMAGFGRDLDKTELLSYNTDFTTKHTQTQSSRFHTREEEQQWKSRGWRHEKPAATLQRQNKLHRIPHFSQVNPQRRETFCTQRGNGAPSTVVDPQS